MVFFSIVYPNHRNKCDGMCWFFLLLFHFMLNHIAMYQFTESIESDFFPSFWSCGLFTTFNRFNKRALSSENSSVVNSRAQKHLIPKKISLIHQNANFFVRWLSTWESKLKAHDVSLKSVLMWNLFTKAIPYIKR